MPTAVVLAVAAATAGAAHAVTPANGGDAGGTPTTVNDGPGDQTEPHVGGNLGVYRSLRAGDPWSPAGARPR